MIGNHRLLCASAIRRGLGARMVSEIFPIELWRSVGSSPLQEFLLEAAELASKTRATVIYPNVPASAEMDLFSRLGISRLRTPEGFSILNYLDNSSQQFDDMHRHAEQHQSALEKLGLKRAVLDGIQRYDDSLHQEASQGWSLDWSFALDELKGALFDGDVMESLRMKETFDLYPLHKRVLGLVEYFVVPRLKDRGFSGGASSIWEKAFPRKIGKKENVGLLATLETTGNWLLYAADFNPAGKAQPIDLAELLDGIVKRMSSAWTDVRVSGVNLRPATPQVHAQQLAALADSSSTDATCMTLYLGKLALMLRNAVEHGTDQIAGEALRLETPGYWKEKWRLYKKDKPGKDKWEYVPIFDWLKATAENESWPSRESSSRESLRKASPAAANALLLTPASLERCLVLMSLVMHGARSQLGI